MSTTYGGNAANNPANITLPSDSDGPVKAADVNVPLEGLMDRTAYIEAGNTTFDGAKLFTGPVSFGDALSVAGLFQTSGISKRGPSSNVQYLVGALSSTSQTVTCTGKDVFFFAGTIGSNLVITLKSTSPAPGLGTVVKFVRSDAPFDAHTITFIREDTSTIITFQASAFAAAEFAFTDVLGSAKWLLSGADGSYV